MVSNPRKNSVQILAPLCVTCVLSVTPVVESSIKIHHGIGYAAWLTEQFNTAPQFSATQSDYPLLPLYPINQPSPCDATCVRDNYTLYPLQKQFIGNALTQPDQLRQRVAFALHELLVVGGSELDNNEASWYAPCLQTIDRNAFGNFRTLLFDITLNPGMGEYMNMRGNSVNGGSPNEHVAS